MIFETSINTVRKNLRKPLPGTATAVLFITTMLLIGCGITPGTPGTPGSSTQDLEWAEVPAGTFLWNIPPQSRTIDYTYTISKYEITNEQYVLFLKSALLDSDITVDTTSVTGYYSGDESWDAGEYEYLDLDSSDIRISYEGNKFVIESGYEKHPVVEVTWFGANAFADYYDWSLPTQEEWFKAAWSDVTTDYQWGDVLLGSQANFLSSGDTLDDDTTPVGYFDGSIYDSFQTINSPSPYNAYDMTGNVWEWTDTFFGSLAPGNRIILGGSWKSPSYMLQRWYPVGNLPTQSTGETGFRVVHKD
jgi:sulfatase modifying factor 1